MLKDTLKGNVILCFMVKVLETLSAVVLSSLTISTKAMVDQEMEHSHSLNLEYKCTSHV